MDSNSESLVKHTVPENFPSISNGNLLEAPMYITIDDRYVVP